MPARVRLNKFLRDCRLGSRRKCERLVLEGRVTLDGIRVEAVGTLVDPQAQEVRVDGEVVRPCATKVYVAANKPRGAVVTACDPQGRTTLYEAIGDLPAGLFNVGRLDMDSEGLLLLTNDGKLAFRLSHPRFEIAKVYHVGVRSLVGDETIARLTEGIDLEDGKAAAKEARVLSSDGERSTVEITLTEGKKREVRRMMAACGCEVEWLRRVKFGAILLGDLEAGAWRHLTRDEVRSLRRIVEEAHLKKLRGRKA